MYVEAFVPTPEQQILIRDAKDAEDLANHYQGLATTANIQLISRCPHPRNSEAVIVRATGNRRKAVVIGVSLRRTLDGYAFAYAFAGKRGGVNKSNHSVHLLEGDKVEWKTEPSSPTQL